MNLEKIIDRIPDWLLIPIIISILVFVIIKIKQIFNFLVIGLFGEDKKPTYKELTGALGFVGIAFMLIEHLVDHTYKPDLDLLIFCAVIVLTMSGLDRVLDIFDKYISNKITHIKKKETIIKEEDEIG